ncbi:MAG: DUF3109 family protein [Prevotellaceae bacterium]|jgi:hypothetical protein|nr:DUF3109 family protein [Prevotellaceae bacterium]
MLQIDNKIVSADILTEYFSCDIYKCFGACCVHGDSGAPLEEEEKNLIEKHFDKLKPYLSPEGLAVIEKQGMSVFDFDNELVTPLIGDSEECVYSCFSGITCICAIEKAYRNGDIPFNKPASCHLYPIRIKIFGELVALNYDRWHICSSAIEKGKKNKTPVFMFLKEPLIRKFGKEFYETLEEIWQSEFNADK